MKKRDLTLPFAGSQMSYAFSRLVRPQKEAISPPSCSSRSFADLHNFFSATWRSAKNVRTTKIATLI